MCIVASSISMLDSNTQESFPSPKPHFLSQQRAVIIIILNSLWKVPGGIPCCILSHLNYLHPCERQGRMLPL